MGILEIENRTENWKTARSFAPFLKDNDLRVNLAKRLLPNPKTPFEKVHIELFWKGVRDWLHLKGKDEADYASDFADCYNSLFPDCPEKLETSVFFESLRITITAHHPETKKPYTGTS